VLFLITITEKGVSTGTDSIVEKWYSNKITRIYVPVIVEFISHICYEQNHMEHMIFGNYRPKKLPVKYIQVELQGISLMLLIAVSSFGESLRQVTSISQAEA